MTDDNGAFSLQNDKGYTTLVVSSMGYTEKEIQLKAGKNNAALAIMLRPTSYELTEVVVKPKREKYSRKNNPAVELIKKVIEHKDDNRIWTVSWERNSASSRIIWIHRSLTENRS